MKPIKIIIEETSTGYSGYFESIDDGVTSVGDNIPELLRNLAEVYELYTEKL